MQCFNCTPHSSHAKISWTLMCCLQSLFLPGSTGVQREFSAIIRPSDSHSWTVVLLILHEACKYPQMCAIPPSWVTLYQDQIARFSCTSLKIVRIARRTFCADENAGIRRVNSKTPPCWTRARAKVGCKLGHSEIGRQGPLSL